MIVVDFEDDSVIRKVRNLRVVSKQMTFTIIGNIELQ